MAASAVSTMAVDNRTVTERLIHALSLLSLQFMQHIFIVAFIFFILLGRFMERFYFV